MEKEIYSTIKPSDLTKSLTVIKFSSPTCGPCRLLKPKFEDISYEGVTKESINIMDSESIDWSLDYNIRSVPTTIIFNKGKEVSRVIGNDINKIKENIEKEL
jgi:thiol-disulfide isomerase/thioredoxin